MLAFRLKELLLLLALKEQGVQGRSILDGALSANECVDARLLEGILGVL